MATSLTLVFLSDYESKTLLDDTSIELYTFVLVLVTLGECYGHMGMRKVILKVLFSHEVIRQNSDFVWLLHALTRPYTKMLVVAFSQRLFKRYILNFTC